jgi:hypothetical protein
MLAHGEAGMAGPDHDGVDPSDLGVLQLGRQSRD